VTDFRSRHGGRLVGSGVDDGHAYPYVRAPRVERRARLLGRSRARADRLVRIVVADDHPLMHFGVAMALRADPAFDVVGQATSDTEVLTLARSAGPDVAVLVTRARGHDGLGCLSRLRECYPDVKVIICSASADLEHIEAAFRLGASGCVVATIERAELAAAIRRVVEATEYHALSVSRLDQDAPARFLGLSVRKPH
jgi:DNA-binding NarL/FixJ family response regulator